MIKDEYWIENSKKRKRVGDEEKEEKDFGKLR